jgi:hypothetical protein
VNLLLKQPQAESPSKAGAKDTMSDPVHMVKQERILHRKNTENGKINGKKEISSMKPRITWKNTAFNVHRVKKFLIFSFFLLDIKFDVVLITVVPGGVVKLHKNG